MTLFPTVEDRLTHILQACGFPNPSQFTAALGEKNSQWRNWITRNSLGRAQTRISELTGASIDWLMTGRGSPFPNGPIAYDGPGSAPKAVTDRIASLERDLADVVAAFIVSLRIFSEKTPGAGRAVAAELRKTLTRPGRPTAVLPELLEAAESGAAAASPASPAAPSKKRVRAK